MPYELDNYNNGNGYNDLFKLIQNSDFKKKRDAAFEDAKSQDLYIMDPMEKDFEIIQKQWDNYMSMTKPFRRRADWITLEYLGLNNQQIYDFCYNRANKDIIDPYYDPSDIEVSNIGTSEDPLYNISESDLTYVPPNNEVPSYEDFINSIEDLDLKLKEADEYSKQTGYVILRPPYADIDSLEHAYYAFQSMIHRHREMSNWKAMELFGMTNDQLYICLRRHVDLQDGSHIDISVDPNAKSYVSEMGAIRKYFSKVIQEGDITNYELESSLKRFLSMQTEGYDKIIGKQLVSDMEHMMDGLTQNIPSATWDYTDLPMYTPDELIDDGVYSSGNPEAPTGGDDIVSSKLFNEKWFEEYKVFFNTGIETDSYREANIERIRRLDVLYSMGNQSKDTNLWSESVRKLGWDPNMPFTGASRSINDKIMNEHFKSMINHYDIIDISRESISPYTEAVDPKSPIYPIYIVLSSGKGAFSDLIKGITSSDYSHAMLSLDPSLHKCYSFGLDTKVKLSGSFIIEDVPKKFKDNLIRVYTFFVSGKIYNTIKTNVDWFISNQKKTIYGWRNLITYLFRIPWERDHALICSQFVDRMLKLGNIDFTKKTSSLIAPADLDKMAHRSKKIYQIFKDKAGKWNPDRMIPKIKSIMSRDKTYKWESADLTPKLEVRDLPVQINKSGDVLVRSFKPIDYDAEFSKCHKLLVEYNKQNNTEAMKVELAKLWSYMLEIEEKLYGGKSISSGKRKDLFRVRAMIIGDFKKYMEVVQRSEKDFDFGTYYENSPYSKSTYRVSGSTIHGLLKLVKDVL